ncbi:MAG: alpha-glucan family phosphorylase, partial [Lentisphaerae bacterium]|nr:alpha-glucan family phosphorylase [Lentisphaerota bacterium]
MHKVRLYNVAPSLPDKLRFLETLSNNLWWCWHPDAIELFRRIEPELWDECGHNPLAFFGQVTQKRLESLCEDDGFLSHLGGVRETFENEVLHHRNGRHGEGAERPQPVAYFSLEYGIHESVRLYSGGLGCLAGDHLKSASDLDIPLVGVGLLYRQGYFRQYLNDDGWQQEAYPENPVHHLPVRKQCDASGRELEFGVPFAEGEARVCVWRLDVGRVPVYLLDTNIDPNPEAFRRITGQLYTADRDIRLRQELLLGLGGFRALRAMGYEPAVYHMNEGHAAFLSLARLEHLVRERGLSVDAALEIIPRTNVFTTHTPVPAGNETFPQDMLKPHLAVLGKALDLDPARILAWGQPRPKEPQAELMMTVLGLRMAHFSNGVSRLHGRVARRMWSYLWPTRPEDEIPLNHVTNGIHVPSWLSNDNAALFDRYLGPEWRDRPGEKKVLARIARIPDEELWRAHETAKARLIRAAREVGERQYRARNASLTDIAEIRNVLRHDALTIGFARRFASYKRATLLLMDPERLKAILSDEKHPVQIVFAGKAHPSDNGGKELIRRIVHFARQPEMRRKIVFLEDYNIRLARYLVQGSDVWLNNPRRPEEASGTSGMKAAVNGVLHCSTLDGWWDEGYTAEAGWAIGRGEAFDNHEYQDKVESQALYNVLENEVIPCFFDRADERVPQKWVALMKGSIHNVMASYTSHRMMWEYDRRFYDVARSESEALLADDAAKAGTLVAQHRRLDASWGKLRIASFAADRDISDLHVGDRFAVTATVHLGDLGPDEVDVQVY